MGKCLVSGSTSLSVQSALHSVFVQFKFLCICVSGFIA